jgi:gliding motility-associated-like protein
VESPVINLTGVVNPTLQFVYLAQGIPGNDFCELTYSSNGGVTRNSLGIMPVTNNAGCFGQGLWTAYSIALPAAVNNNANVKIGFRWQKNDPTGQDPSFAVDDIQILKTSSVTFTIPANACVNQSVQATVTGTVSGATSYTWESQPAGAVFNPATGTQVAVTFPSAGTYTVVCAAMNGTNVLSTYTQVVTVNNVPTITITPSSPTICVGQSAILTANGANSYTWTPASTLSSSLIANPVANPTVTTAYVVTGEQNGCTGTGTIILVVDQGPPLNVSVSHTAVCAGYNSTLSASGANSYTWTGGNLAGPVNQPSISVGPGTYTVSADAPGNTCPAYSVITIGTLAPLNIVVSQSDYTTCIATNNPKYSKPITLIAGGATYYSWAPCDQYITPCVGPTVVVRPQTTTQYTVTGFTSVCSGTTIITVTVIPQATINVVPPSPITCIGSCLNFTVVNTNTNLIGPFTYSWTEPNNAPASLTNPLSATTQGCPTVSATYTVEMFDGMGCVTMPRLVHTTILPQPIVSAMIPTINGVPVNTVCYTGNITGISNTIVLSAQNQNTGLPPGVVPTFTWCATSTSAQPCGNDLSIITPVNDYSVIVLPNSKVPSVKTYTVRSGFNGIDGCYGEDTVTIRIIDCRYVTQVSFNIINNEDTICTNQCITFTNTTDAGEPQTCNWIFPGGNPATSTLQAPTVCYNLPGNYNVILTVGNPYGPPVTKGINQMVKVFDYPNTTIVPPGQLASDTTIRFGSSIQLNASGATYYNWYPNPFMTCLNCPNQYLKNMTKSQQFIVEGYFVPQCVSRDTINVIVLEDCGEMYIPNAFSPNNRDHPENETFKVYGYCLKNMLLQIFNRWGQKVFETTRQDVGWDGTFDGEPLNSGVYVYRLEGTTYDNKKISLKGNVTLIR